MRTPQNLRPSRMGLLTAPSSPMKPRARLTAMKLVGQPGSAQCGLGPGMLRVARGHHRGIRMMQAAAGRRRRRALHATSRTARRSHGACLSAVCAEATNRPRLLARHAGYCGFSARQSRAVNLTRVVCVSARNSPRLISRSFPHGRDFNLACRRR
jgi:hypothetical protein